MKLHWQERALIELDEALAYISERNPDAAYKLVQDIFASVKRNLPDNPNIGRPGRVENTRELVVHKNYIVAYRINRDEIEILSVTHAAQLWPASFE